MGLSKDEQAALEALQRKAEEPDEDDFEIELFTPEGHGARVPYSKGRSYLQTHFGIDLDPEPEGDSDGKAGKKSPKSPKTTGGAEPSEPANPGPSLFRQRQQRSA